MKAALFRADRRRRHGSRALVHENAPAPRPIPAAWRETKVRITPCRVGFDVEVVEGLLTCGWRWTLTRAGAARKARRVLRRLAAQRERREATVEIVVDRDEA